MTERYPKIPVADNSHSHDFTCWWGYTTLFNILDYPSTTLPIKDLKISAEKDPKDLRYKPLDNPFDKPTYDMCKCKNDDAILEDNLDSDHRCVDDPELFSSQPVCLQVVGFPYKDEELVAVSEVIDSVVNV